MADWKTAIAKTLVHEGGYQNRVNDWANWRGGKAMMQAYLASHDPDLFVNLIGTNYGITAQDMPNLDAAGMRALTPEQATAYYAEHYWKTLYSQIDNQLLAEKLFDMGVLFGVGVAVKMLQVSLSQGITAISDGVFGPNTLAATNERGDLNRYKAVLYNHCMNVVNNNPEEADDLSGWVTRIQS